MPDKTLIALHLLKTGGTALRQYVDNAFPKENRISHLGDQTETETQLDRISNMSDEDKKNIRIVFGHFAAELRPLFPKSGQITVVREPFARLVSQYVYERHNAEALGLDPKSRPLMGEISMPELCDSILRMGGTGENGNLNLQARTIGHFLGVDPGSIKESDIPGFVEEFDLIGLQEYFALFIFLLNGYYQFPLIPMPMVYSYADNVRRFFPQWLVTECRKHANFDVQLYELAKAKFDNDVNQLFGTSADIAAKWEAYRRATSELLEQQIADKHNRLVAARKQAAETPHH